jgi:cell division septation protein DedD
VATAEIAADPGAVPPLATQTATPSATEPPAPPDELTYAERLQKDTPPQEALKPAAAAVPVPAPRPERAAPQPVKNTSPRTLPATVPAHAPQGVVDPSGPGFAVQVMIFDTRKEADSLAARLIAKGYPAFVMDPVKGAPRGIYRVRVGKYKNRRDAEAASSRLETVEQFKPWIAR